MKPDLRVLAIAWGLALLAVLGMVLYVQGSLYDSWLRYVGAFLFAVSIAWIAVASGTRS